MTNKPVPKASYSQKASLGTYLGHSSMLTRAITTLWNRGCASEVWNSASSSWSTTSCVGALLPTPTPHPTPAPSVYSGPFSPRSPSYPNSSMAPSCLQTHIASFPASGQPRRAGENLPTTCAVHTSTLSSCAGPGPVSCSSVSRSPAEEATLRIPALLTSPCPTLCSPGWHPFL
jgi:hypothetical protein